MRKNQGNIAGASAWGVALLAVTALGGCNRGGAGNPAPPKVETPAELPTQTSTIVVPVTASLPEIETGINQRTPPVLWSIDRRESRCIPAKRVKLLGVKAKVLPDIGCRIVGQVTRGRIRLSGSGNVLNLTLPVQAVIRVRDVGGVIKQETATGRANVRATVRLSVNQRWDPVAKVNIAYDWTDPPGIDFLGQRIKFAEKADAKLRGVIAGLERDLPKELVKLRARERLAGIWRQGFTTISLNREKPPAWMTIAPQRLGFGGYRITGNRLEMVLAVEALTRTYVSDAEPAKPTPTPLPPPSRAFGARGLKFFIPVLADYAQLEPVVERVLKKRAAKGVTIKGVGAVDAKFGKVTIYATEGGRLAVGIKAEVEAKGNPLTKTHGEVWLWGTPYNDVNSQLVKVRDLQIAATTDRQVVNLLIQLFNDPQVREDIRAALSHDFVKDYTKVLVAAKKAIGARREGDFVLSANVTNVSNGQLKVTGQGLFLPVEANGTATIAYRPK